MLQKDYRSNFDTVNAAGYADPTMAKALARLVWENDKKEAQRKTKFRLAWVNPEDQAKRG